MHITPSELDNMYWYDIIYMLNEYQNYVEETNDRYKQQEEEYKQQMPEVPKFEQPKIPQMKMPDMNSLTKGFKLN